MAAPAGASGAAFRGFQSDPRHSGHVKGAHLRPPLHRLWARDLGGSASYPVIAHGRIFLTVANTGYTGTTLMALDASTGRTLWSHTLVPGNYRWSNATLHRGLLINATDTGHLTAYRPKTGVQVWSTPIGDPSPAPPTASHGSVYVSTFTAWYDNTGDESTADGGVYAVRTSDGHLRWRRPVYYGDASAPTLGNGRVYENYGGGQVYALEQSSGATAWRYDSGESGGGGATTTLYAGELWTRAAKGRQDPLVFRARTGKPLRHFQALTDPAFAHGVGYFARGYAGLWAIRAKRGGGLWTFTPKSPIITPPLVVNGIVYGGYLNGRVYGLDARTGRVRFKDQTGATFNGDNPSSVGQPTNGLGAAGRLLVVPNAKGVVVYRGSKP